MPSFIIPTAEPFLFPGGPTACLLVHGFTGTPKEMRWMGEYLAEQGHTVLGVRLAGHATHPDDLIRTRWRDWLASVEAGWYLLESALTRYHPMERSIFVIGLSMGGVLSLLLSAQRPVSGLVTISTPYALPQDPRLPFIKILRWFQPKVKKGEPDWHDKDAAETHIDYPFYPTRSIQEMRDLLVQMRAALPRVTAPVLMIHSRQDRSVPPEHMEQICQRLGSRDKQMMWVEDSGHVVPCEPPRKKVFKATAQFIKDAAQNHR